MASMGEFQEEATADQEEHKGLSYICQKTSGWSPSFEGRHSVDRGHQSETFPKVCVSFHLVKVTQHFIENTSTGTYGGGGSVMVWGNFTASGSGPLEIIDGTRNSGLPEQPEGEFPTITLQPQAHLGSAAGQGSEAPRSKTSRSKTIQHAQNASWRFQAFRSRATGRLWWSGALWQPLRSNLRLSFKLAPNAGLQRYTPGERCEAVL